MYGSARGEGRNKALPYRDTPAWLAKSCQTRQKGRHKKRPSPTKKRLSCRPGRLDEARTGVPLAQVVRGEPVDGTSSPGGTPCLVGATRPTRPESLQLSALAH